MFDNKIFWFSYFSNDEPSVRYRSTFLLKELERTKGIKFVQIFPSYSPPSIIRFIYYSLYVIFLAKSSQVVVIQKVYSRRIYASILKIVFLYTKCKKVYDIDDAVYTIDKDKTLKFFLKNTDLCLVGSEALYKYTAKYCNDVRLLTSPVVNHSFYHKQVSEFFTIGWIGYYSAHSISLKKYIFPALRKISFKSKIVLLGVRTEKEKTDVMNEIGGNKFLIIEMPLISDWMDEDEIYSHISNFDLGLSPLIDTEFNRAKSAYKMKQYLSCGVPVLASPIGENIRFLTNCVNGYFCYNSEDFYNQILNFYNMPNEKYIHYSENALQSSNVFLMNKIAEEFHEIIQ